MFKFIKTQVDQYDNADVIIQSKYNDLSLEELFPIFKSFLQACGYSINYNEDIDIIKPFDENEKTEEIELDLTNEQFVVLATMAHEKNITFNELVNEILIEQIKIAEANEKFSDVVNQLKKRDMEQIKEDANKKEELIEQPDASQESFADELFNDKYVRKEAR